MVFFAQTIEIDCNNTYLTTSNSKIFAKCNPK